MSQMIVSCGYFIGCGLSPSSLKTPCGQGPVGRDLWAGFSSLWTPSNQGLLAQCWLSTDWRFHCLGGWTHCQQPLFLHLEVGCAGAVLGYKKHLPASCLQWGSCKLYYVCVCVCVCVCVYTQDSVWNANHCFFNQQFLLPVTFPGSNGWIFIALRNGSNSSLLTFTKKKFLFCWSVVDLQILC